MEMNTTNALLVHPDDNVLVVVEDTHEGQLATVKLTGEQVRANQFIKQGHKIARRDIAQGEAIVKYGVAVGEASRPITKGDWVNEDNDRDTYDELKARERAALLEQAKDLRFTLESAKPQPPKLSRNTVMGFPRQDGRFGIRNYVIVISLVQCANTASQKIARACGDIPAIVVEAACGEFANRFARTRLGWICAGIHPNVYGVLLVSLGCQQADPQDVAAEIKKYGKEVETLCIQTDGGQTEVIKKGIAIVKGMQARAAEQKRVPCPVSELVLCAYNGGSDWTSGLSSNAVCGEMLDWHEANGGRILSNEGRGRFPMRGGSYQVARQILEIGQRFNDDCKARTGHGLSEVNPTPGNKAGGLTTLMEKDLGSAKTGGHSKIRQILDVGQTPPGPGAWGLDQPQGANDAYACTTYAMSGAHILAFTTGKGNPIGTAVMPCVKITGNPKTYETLEELFDFSAVPVLKGEQSASDGGLALYERLLDFCDGEQTKSEQFHDWSYTIPHGTSYNGDYEKPCGN